MSSTSPCSPAGHGCLPTADHGCFARNHPESTGDGPRSRAPKLPHQISGTSWAHASDHPTRVCLGDFGIGSGNSSDDNDRSDLACSRIGELTLSVGLRLQWGPVSTPPPLSRCQVGPLGPGLFPTVLRTCAWLLLAVERSTVSISAVCVLFAFIFMLNRLCKDKTVSPASYLS